MMKLSVSPRVLALSAVGVCLIGGAVVAQTAPLPAIQWDVRRLDQLDRNVRRLERALTQRNAAGEPVLVQPDPEVVALQGRVAAMDQRLQDLEQTFRRVNADGERLTFQLDETQRANETLRTRLAQAEERVGKLETEAELNAPIVSNSPTGAASGDLAAAVRLLGSDRPRAVRALETLIVTWPEAAEAREANLHLGDLIVQANDRANAVSYYAAALKDWPKTAWAPEATLKLADALLATDRKTQGCAALSEFTRRYPDAPAPLKTRATQTRTRAACAA